MKKEWAYYQLGDICDVLNGLWTGKQEPFVNVAVIRNTNFSKDCRLKLDDVAFIDVEAKQFAKRKLQLGDIIIEKSGGSDKQPVGRAVLFDISDGDYSFSNFTSALRIKDKGKFSPTFVHRCLYGHYLKGETLRMQSKTTGLHNLDMKAFLRLPIPNLPLEEQEHIVAELDLLHGIIDKQKTQLKELDTLAQSIFYDMFGNPVENERGWEVSTLNDVCSNITDGSHNPPKGGCKSGFMMLSSKNIFDGYYTIEEPRYLSKEEFVKENNRTSLKCGDILLTIVGTIGRCCVFDGANQVALQRSVAVLKPKKSLVSIFLMKQLQASRAVLENEAKGVAQKGIYLNQLKRLNVILPPTSLQQSFAEKIAAIEQQKDTINRSIEESQKLFDYTMDKYFG